MFDGISEDRFRRMTDQELRWFDNVKKAFDESDQLYTGGRMQDCMEPMCKAIDVAKTLRRSLLGQDTSGKLNKDRFIEFLDLEIPDPKKGGLQITLVDARTKKAEDYSFSRMVYAIRCMIHEGENLNVDEGPDYHILLDWRNYPDWGGVAVPSVSGTRHDPCLPWKGNPHLPVMGSIENDRITLNGHAVWWRLREVMSKLVTFMDSMIALSNGATSFQITISPPLGSVKPSR